MTRGVSADAVASGIITLVQEQRFQLVADDGVAHLFLLAHDVSLTPSDLRSLARSRRRVQVDYKHCPDLVAALATRIEVLGQTEEGAHEAPAIQAEQARGIH